MLHNSNALRCRSLPGGAVFVAVCLLCAPPAHAQAPPGGGGNPAEAGSHKGSTPLTKDQAVALALQHNQSLRAQRLTVDQSRAGEVTAGLKPNLLLTSSNADFPVFTPSQLTLFNIRNTQTFTESLSYRVERGGKRERRIQVARDTTEMTARTVDDAERQVRFQVGQAFVSVLLAQANLDFSRTDLRDFTQVVELNRGRVKSGDLAEGDFLKIALQKL